MDFWRVVDSRAIRERECPFCGAKRGERCISSGRHRNSVPHVGRTQGIYLEELKKRSSSELTE